MRFLYSTIILSFLWPLYVQANPPIEIYAGGKRYESLEAYKLAAKGHGVELKEVEDDTKQQEQLQAEARSLGVDVDPKKMKTIQIKPVISSQTVQKLNLASADRGVPKLLADFRQNWSNPKPQKFITAEQLEAKIREAVGNSQDPVLLISDQGKMRIMALSSQQKQESTP